MTRQCIIAGCDAKYYGKGFCKKHHQWHWKRGLLPESKTTKELFLQKTNVKGADDCWEWLGGKDANGYGNFQIGDYLRAHRCSFFIFNGPIKDGLHVLHKCNNTSCVNPNHLYLGTHQQNMADMAASGIQKGINKACAIVNEEIAHAAMDLRLAGFSAREAANILQISCSIIRSITYGKSWGWSVGMAAKVEKYHRMDKAQYRTNRGSRRVTAKINETDAMQIFAKEGLYKDIAAEYGISRTLVGNIKRKTSWRHIHF